MADIKIEIDGDSEEAVALALLKIIMDAEDDAEEVDRAWVLETYSACLATVRGALIVDGDDEEDDEMDEDDMDDEDAAPVKS